MSHGLASGSQHANLKTPLKDQPDPVLGQGYSDLTQQPTINICVNPDNYRYVGNSESVLNLSDAKSFSEIQQDLSLSLSSSFSYGLYNASVDADFANSIKQDDFSETFYFDEKITLPDKVFTPAGFGVDALVDSVKPYYKDPATFHQLCGDKFVYRIHEGALLVAAVKVHFASRQAKSTFDASISGGISSMVDAEADISQTIKSKGLQASISVYAEQIGGDHTQLAKIFGEPTSKGYPILNCSLDNLGDCDKAMGKIVVYAKNDFPEQLKFTGGDTDHAAPLGYEYMDYVRLGLTAGQAIASPEVEAARKDLGEKYMDYNALQSHVNHLLTGAYGQTLDATYREQLQRISDELKQNISAINDEDEGAPACFNDPNSCVAIQRKVEGKLQPLSDSEKQLLDFLRVGYGQNVYDLNNNDPGDSNAPLSLVYLPTTTGVFNAYRDNQPLGSSLNISLATPDSFNYSGIIQYRLWGFDGSGSLTDNVDPSPYADPMKGILYWGRGSTAWGPSDMQAMNVVFYPIQNPFY